MLVPVLVLVLCCVDDAVEEVLVRREEDADVARLVAWLLTMSVPVERVDTALSAPALVATTVASPPAASSPGRVDDNT